MFAVFSPSSIANSLRSVAPACDPAREVRPGELAEGGVEVEAFERLVDRTGTIVGKYREGDIRHCVADISKARQLLGYEPKIALEAGLAELLDWLGTQNANDRVEAATAELSQKGLVK